MGHHTDCGRSTIIVMFQENRIMSANTLTVSCQLAMTNCLDNRLWHDMWYQCWQRSAIDDSIMYTQIIIIENECANKKINTNCSECKSSARMFTSEHGLCVATERFIIYFDSATPIYIGAAKCVLHFILQIRAACRLAGHVHCRCSTTPCRVHVFCFRFVS